MAQVTLKGNPVNTNGELPAIGSQAPAFTFVKNDLSEISSADLKGKKVVLNIFPSLDTSTCAQSVRTFNQKVSDHPNSVILCVSKDLPFANARFCGAEGIKNAITVSSFRNQDFAAAYGVEITDSPLKGLHARSVVVIDEFGVVKHTQLVGEIVDEPNYEAALSAL